MTKSEPGRHKVYNHHITYKYVNTGRTKEKDRPQYGNAWRLSTSLSTEGSDTSIRT